MLIAVEDSSDAVVTAGAGQTHWLQPLNDPRWPDFVRRHPHSSVFHTREWLEALRRTYGYEAVAVTTCAHDTDLTNAIVFCRVESWLTGRRLVSLPFSDHCEHLADDSGALLGALDMQLGRLRYIEMRTKRALETTNLGSRSTYSYCLHQIDLRPDLDTLFGNCHKTATQQTIRRAEREGLRYEEGRSRFLLDCFYRLLLVTRRRHMIPPQPRRWFQNLIDSFGEALKIRVAFKANTPIAAILTLRHKDTLVYKYGCSNSQFHNLGGVQLLLWKSILEAKQDGLCVFDFGRSEWSESGLIMFKDRWGAQRSTLTYIRLLGTAGSKASFESSGANWKERMAKSVFKHLPDGLLSTAGNLLYRHIG